MIKNDKGEAFIKMRLAMSSFIDIVNDQHILSILA